MSSPWRCFSGGPPPCAAGISAAPAWTSLPGSRGRAVSGLWSLGTVVMTPHAGGAVAGNFPRVAERALEHVTAVLSGRAVAAEDVAV